MRRSAQERMELLISRSCEVSRMERNAKIVTGRDPQEAPEGRGAERKNGRADGETKIQTDKIVIQQMRRDHAMAEAAAISPKGG